MFRSIGMVRFKHKINLFSNWQLQFASMYRNAPMCHSPHMIFKKEYFFLNYIICLCKLISPMADESSHTSNEHETIPHPEQLCVEYTNNFLV